MQAYSNPPSTGRAWVRDGWRLFRLQPVGFIILLFTYVSGILLAHMLLQLVVNGITAILPFLSRQVLGTLGSMGIVLLVPGLSVGFMEACRAAPDQKTPLLPQLLIKPFRVDGATNRGLLILGAVYSISMTIVFAIATGVDLPDLDPNAPAGANLPPSAINDVLAATGLAMLAYLPVGMALWYAPVLVAWHRMTPVKAMFFSFAACWRNRWAFLIYGLSWFGIAMALSVAGGLLRLIGFGPFSMWIIMPLLVIMGATMYCSIYASYTSVLVARPEPVPPAPPDAS